MGLHFFPDPDADESAIRVKAKAFSDSELRPTILEDDLNSTFQLPLFHKLGKQGLTGISIPKEFGGGGLSYRCYYAALEELAQGSASMSVVTGVTNLLQGAILKFGSAEQKANFLPSLAKGEMLGAFSLSEPQSGSDAAGLRLAAKKVPGGYVLNGAKSWCTNAGYAGLHLVMVRTSPERTNGITSFLVPKDTKGFRVGRQEKKLGLRASSLAELIFDECFLNDDQLIGKEGEGFAIALSQLDNGRISIGTAGVALAREALERGMLFLKEQKKLNLPHPIAFAECLADFYAQVQAMKLLITQAARMRDEGKRLTVVASQIKLLGSELAMKVTSEVIVGMAEKGYVREAEVERLMRDAKALQIVEGTNQIQRIVLAREMEEMFV